MFLIVKKLLIMKPNGVNISLEKLSLETQRLIKGLEILKQKLNKMLEPETTTEDR